jgi:hypothetical protein
MVTVAVAGVPSEDEWEKDSEAICWQEGERRWLESGVEGVRRRTWWELELEEEGVGVAKETCLGLFVVLVVVVVAMAIADGSCCF